MDNRGPVAAGELASGAIWITSLDPLIARTLEPRAPRPEKRLAAVRTLADACIPVFVSVAPVVPGITDHEMEHILERAAEAGAKAAYFLPVRLPYAVAPLVREIGRASCRERVCQYV